MRCLIRVVSFRCWQCSCLICFTCLRCRLCCRQFTVSWRSFSFCLVMVGAVCLMASGSACVPAPWAGPLLRLGLPGLGVFPISSQAVFYLPATWIPSLSSSLCVFMSRRVWVRARIVHVGIIRISHSMQDRH